MINHLALSILSLTAVLTLSAAPAAHASSCGNGVINQGEECDDGNRSYSDGCNPIDCTIYRGWTCTGQPSVCTPLPFTLCGNGVVNASEQCDDGNLTSGDGCQSNCTVQSGYECTGSPSLCAPTSPSLCGNGNVDSGEECDDGNAISGDGCQADCTVQSGYECTGTSPSVCNPTGVDLCGNGIVDSGEACDGGPCCLNCAFRPSTTVCRPVVSASCDVEERCSGASASCPADVIGCPDVDGIDCVHPVCDASGECSVTDDCVEICRGPNFWAVRASVGNGNASLLETVLDEVGSLEVCGETIDSSTDLGDLDSVVEALCVRPQGIQERQLFRQLVTAALNCTVSEGGTCDDIVSRFGDVSFDDCDSLCAGQPVPSGPTVDECVDQLACFNRGGHLVDGGCALGTCLSNPGEFCGADFGYCLDETDLCESFADDCSRERLCTTNLDTPADICPRKLRSVNRKLCRDARNNECTIDSCN